MSSICRPSSTLFHIALAWLLVLLPGTMATMPYNPTWILQNGANLYIFQASSDSSSQFELGSIKISSTIAASDLPYTTLHSALPFLGSTTQYPFTPVLDKEGNITVYTGDCALGASGAETWTFTPERSDISGNGTWSQEDLSWENNTMRTSTIGSNYLNGGMTFSALVNGDATDIGAYFFGGMCPFLDSNSSNWQTSANYSNLMVTLTPSQDGTKPLNYQLGQSTSHGPPVAEAGFTLTGLQPSFSNRSDGTQTQQQNFVLVGGHTSAAFINMSQVALFSLPQQAWTFISVPQPNAQQTDLAVRTDVDEVEPRSGHSAVLTPDGQRLIIFGGWIGDIDTPAIPQLAILDIGDGYGGEGDWKWTVPTTSGSGLSTGSGVYGHGAVMLPGGVMMIMGGYIMSTPSSRSRRSEPDVSTKTLFFNVTSNDWISEYTPPQEATSSEPVKSGPLATTSQKAGLGVGIGVGTVTIICLLCFYLWYTKRMKDRREVREMQLKELAMGAHRYNLNCPSPGVDGRGGNIESVDYFDDHNDNYSYPTSGTYQNQGWRRSNGQEAERTGLLVEIPSPTRGLRRNLSGRAQHTSRYDESVIKGSGHIHPIDELEEEPETKPAYGNNNVHDQTPLMGQPEMTECSANKRASIFDNAPILDPFTDSHRISTVGPDQKNITHSAPVSPIRERGEEPNHGSSDWQLSIGALLPRRSSPGRSSPTKSERTGSNLSDRNTWSNLSSNSASIGRSASMRSTAILNASHVNPIRSTDASSVTDKAERNSSRQSLIIGRTKSFTRNSRRSNAANADADSFRTACTSFMQLQADGEILLGGNPDQERARPGTASTSNGSSSNGYQTTELSMSRAETRLEIDKTATFGADARFRPFTESRRSWLGSFRRVLSRSVATTAEDRIQTRTRSLTASVPALECYTDDPGSPTNKSKATRYSLPSASPPRRAASDASFWRSKRGKQDWLDEELDPNDPQARWRRNSGDDWGAPEDLVLAEQERLKREWRERSMLINLKDDLPTPGTPIKPDELGVPDEDKSRGRSRTPLDEEDWDVEAAVERRVVQVMFTMPKSKLRVVNADVDRGSILSMAGEPSSDGTANKTPHDKKSSSPGRVRDLAGHFEQLQASPRTSPRPSPSPSTSIRSLKIRAKPSSRSLALAPEDD